MKQFANDSFFAWVEMEIAAERTARFRLKGLIFHTEQRKKL